MKILKIWKAVLLILLVAFVYQPARAQKQKKAEAVQKMVRDADFMFNAQIALPMSGNSRHLTSAYHITVSGDTLVSYLPYFGRAYRAPADLTGGGIDFRSTDFEYTVKERRKGGWDVKITPKDAEDVRQMFLTVSENGSASLRVNSDRRQSISFNGYISEEDPG